MFVSAYVARSRVFMGEIAMKDESSSIFEGLSLF
jgi:hypothetical protein